MSMSGSAMRRLSDAFSRLKSNTHGNVTVLFAFSIIPMVTAIGIGIDVTSLYMTRSKLQGALDSGALAGAQTYFSRNHASEAARLLAAKEVAHKYMRANVPDITTSGVEPTIEMEIVGENLLEYKASAAMSTAFAKFLGYETFTVNVYSTVTAGEARITEVVLALDNTSSMFSQNRFVLMREAAKDFTAKMFNQNADPTMLRIAVVPWSTTVNIKSEAPASPNSTSVPMSQLAAAGSRLTPTAPMNSRLTYVKHHETGSPFFNTTQVNDIFAPVEWRGCIRAADDEREVQSNGNIPSALTDAPPPQMRWPINYLDYRDDTAGYVQKSNCRQERKNHSHGGGGNTGGNTGGGNTGTQANLFLPDYGKDIDRTLSEWSAEPGDQSAHVIYHQVCDKQWISINVPWCSSWGEEGRVNAYWPADEPCSTNGKNINSTKKACVSDPNEFAFFAGGGDDCSWEPESDFLPWNAHKPIYGPNLNCPTAMLPLSSNRRQVIRKLDHMYPVPGGTHADVGLMWALRALSPRTSWTNFWGLTTAQAPIPFSSDAGRKIVILLTDGNNSQPIDYEGYYGCTRNYRPGGIGNCWRSPDVKKLDEPVLNDLTLDACTAMKDTYDIELYTIAVDINDPNHIGLLQDCASSTEHAFNISSAELADTFDELAQTNLRIVR